ncbi:MAG: IS66 family insertion sequence element accessory protein TnpB [Bilifractor sp.]|jgi:transposase
MLRDVSSLTKIYIACGHTDLRKGIDGLASLVKEHFRLDPFQKDVLFLFCGSRMDRFKALVWEGDGFLLLYKRLEAGSFKWPRNTTELAEISPDQFRKLLDGFVVIDTSTIQTDLHPEECL